MVVGVGVVLIVMVLGPRRSRYLFLAFCVVGRVHVYNLKTFKN